MVREISNRKGCAKKENCTEFTINFQSKRLRNFRIMDVKGYSFTFMALYREHPFRLTILVNPSYAIPQARITMVIHGITINVLG